MGRAVVQSDEDTPRSSGYSGEEEEPLHPDTVAEGISTYVATSREKTPRGLALSEMDDKSGKARDHYGGSEDTDDLDAESSEMDAWLDEEPVVSFSTDGRGTTPAFPGASKVDSRLEHIKESHSLLKQFTPKELKVLLNLKRNTSPKAWTLREDLVVLTMHSSNREIAETLTDRNKEAVKKRLQLLRSKGLAKRPPNASAP